jgi:hypothetical protein
VKIVLGDVSQFLEGRDHPLPDEVDMTDFTKSKDGKLRRTFQIEFRLSVEDIANLIVGRMETFVSPDEYEVYINCLTRKAINTLIRTELLHHGTTALEKSASFDEAMYNRIRGVVNKLM